LPVVVYEANGVGVGCGVADGLGIGDGDGVGEVGGDETAGALGAVDAAAGVEHAARTATRNSRPAADRFTIGSFAYFFEGWK
jgi:hypothetical protein